MANRKGRPSKLTKAVRETIVEGIELGMTHKHAAQRARVGYSTMRLWLTLGEAVRERIDNAGEEGVEITLADKRYLDFLAAVEEANAEAMAYHLINLEKHSTNDPKVSMWILERRFPETFGPPMQKHQSDVTMTQKVRIIDYGFDDESG